MSESDGEKANQRPGRKRWRNQRRDQTFKRLHIDSTSSSEAESAERDSSSSNHTDSETSNDENVGVNDHTQQVSSPLAREISGEDNDFEENANDNNALIAPFVDRENFQEGEEDGEESGEKSSEESGEEASEESAREEENEGHVNEEELLHGAREAYSEEEGAHEDSVSESSGNSGQEEDSGSDQEEDSNTSGGEEEEDENFDVNDNHPLYDGARISLKQSALAILTFSLSHNLSHVCINDLLELIDLHCGQNSLSLKSLYLFKKYFDMLGQDHVIRHYYCSVCEISLPSKDAVCPTCTARNHDDNIDDPDEIGDEDDKKNEVQFFIEFSVERQLKTLYKRPGFVESLQFKANRVKKNVDNIEDMYDGQIYVELTDEGFLSDPNNISFTMYFDGVSIFKSAKFSIWPIYLSINELKYKDRFKQENIVVAGIWFGKKKPNPNLFLTPIWNNMQVLQNHGVQLKCHNAQIIRVKGKVISAVGDLPAKALFMRLIQYNGLHSCFCCLSSGGRLEIGPRSAIHVFPYTRNFVIRNNAEMQIFADQAALARRTDPKAVVYGVKGPTLLSAMLPDLVRCMAIDPMHGIFLGLMKTLMDLWFSSEHSNSAFSIHGLVDVVDDRLRQIKPPFHFQRVPRSISAELALFKASDYKILFFFFSVVVFYGILPDVYWEHHCKIVCAISLLSQDSVSPAQVDTAEELLDIYVRDLERLYGLRYMGLNVHQLLHLGMNVRNLGPLWVYSCFTYESLNGQLSRLVHGTRHAALQICSTAYVCLNLSVLINKMEESAAKTLCLKLMQRGVKKVKFSEFVTNDISVVDKCESRSRVPHWIRQLLQDDMDILGGRVMFFKRLKKKTNVFCSEEYVRSKRKLSCYVEVFHNNTPYLCKIKTFIRWSPCLETCPKNCAECPRRFLCIVELYDRVPWRLHELGHNITLPYLDKVVPSGVQAAYPVESIRSACLYIMVGQDEFMCVPVNSLEIE